MQGLMKISDVEYVVMDQCQFGADDGKGNPIRKPTRWLSNSKEVLRELDRCEGAMLVVGGGGVGGTSGDSRSPCQRWD